MMRFLVISVCVFALIGGTAQAFSFSDFHVRSQSSAAIDVRHVSSSDLDAAKAFVDKMTQDGISVLATPGLSDDKLQSEFRRLLKRSFDIKTIGRFALGSYWRSASAAQQKEYLRLFEAMIIRVYSKRFGDYNGEAILVDSARPEGKYDVLVASSIVLKSGQKVRVDWRVRQKKGTYKVVDVVVEGVSMALTQRSDFSSVIQRGGGKIDVLIEHLRNQ